MAHANWRQMDTMISGLVRRRLHDLLRHMPAGHNDLWACEKVTSDFWASENVTS